VLPGRQDRRRRILIAAAKALNLTILQSILLRANRVIE
jgi:hypothetical protein